MFKLKFSSSILLLLFFEVNINAQSHTSDSAIYQIAFKNVISNYQKSIGNDLALYNGSEYVSYGHGYLGNPFFVNDNFKTENICFNGITYFNIPLLYDIINDKVIIQNKEGDKNIVPEQTKISSFTIGGHHFISYHNNNTELKNGYYEILSEGVFSAIIKRTKKISYGKNAEDSIQFKSYDKYYISSENELIEIKNNNSIIKTFNDEKTKIRAFLNNNSLNFKKEPDKSLSMVTTYYNELIK